MADDEYQDIVDYTGDDLDVEDFADIQYAVKLNEVSRVYKAGRIEIEALRNVNLEVKLGDFIVIAGHSGSGKTTLLNIIGAIDLSSSGRVQRDVVAYAHYLILMH